MSGTNQTQLIVIPGERDLIVTRIFDAPRELVFKAFTDPHLIPIWWGPDKLTTRVEKLDLRPGGEWRFIQHDPAGAEYVFFGVFKEIVPPERLVQTFNFEGYPGDHEVLETLTLEDLGGRTLLTSRSVYRSVEDRDGMIAEGMEEGMNEGYVRLDVYLAREKIS